MSTTKIDKYFRALGLDTSASFAQVKEARAWYTKAFHPDRFPKDSKDVVKAEDKQKEINLAFEELKKWFQSGSADKTKHSPGTASKPAQKSKSWQGELDSYLEFLVESGKSPSTIKNFISDVRSFSTWYSVVHGANSDLHRIDLEANITAYAWDLSDQGYSPSTIARHLYSLKGFLTFIGLEAEFIIFLAYEFKSEVRRQTKSLTEKQLSKFLRAVEIYAFEWEEALIRFILHTGISVSELCALKWKDVSFSKATGRQPKCIIKVEGRTQDRLVPLSESAIRSLKTLGLDELLGKRGKLLDAKIFWGENQEMTPKMVHYLVDRYGKMASLDVTPSMLRNTFCKKLVQSGVPLEHLAMLIGVTEQSAKAHYQSAQPTMNDLLNAVDRA